MGQIDFPVDQFREVAIHHRIVQQIGRMHSSDSRSGNPDNSGGHSFPGNMGIEDRMYDTGTQLREVDR